MLVHLFPISDILLLHLHRAHISFWFLSGVGSMCLPLHFGVTEHVLSFFGAAFHKVDAQELLLWGIFGAPVVKTLCFLCLGPRFNPWVGT